jgi:hypothetical protein
VFTYTTPDDRRWLYGGGQPVGIEHALDQRIGDAGFPNLGQLGWREHAQLWAGAITGRMVDDAIDAIVQGLIYADPQRTATITAQDVAVFLRRLLTHPG